MKIALVAPDLRKTSGGPAVSVVRLAEALAREGACVTVHALGELPTSDQPNLRFASSSGGWPRRLGRSPAMRKALLESHAEIVHASGLWMLPLRYAAEAAHGKRIPLVISPRGMLAPWSLGRSPLKKKAALLLVHPGAFHHAAGWHATSALEEQDIRGYGLTQPICVAPNGVTPPGDAPEDVRRHYLGRAPELGGQRIVLFYSRFHSKKRILELLSDFAALAPLRPDWHLLAVGIPEQYTVEELRAAARDRGIATRTTILDGREGPAPYALAELFVLPTHNENFGQVVAEALAAGVPVLTTTGTPWGELDRVGAGRCVDLAGVREALGEMLAQSSDRLREAGSLGRQWVGREFGWDTTARRLLAFYKSLRDSSSRALSALNSS